MGAKFSQGRVLAFFMISSCWLCVLQLVLQAGGAEALGEPVVPMKKYTIDLDQPPSERWIPLLKDFKSSAPLIVEYFSDEYPKDVAVVIDKLMGDLKGYFGELGEEMEAIANYLDIDLGVIVTLNLSYELRRLGGGRPNTTGNSTVPPPPAAAGVEHVTPGSGGMACTSIVAQDPNGHVFHGRNMDWNLPNDIRNLTVQADFVKNGTIVFTADVTTGYVGIVTGVSKNGFSLSINERERGGEPLVDSLNALLRHAKCPTHLERQVLTAAQSYNEAIDHLKKEVLSAPVYYISAGSQPNQGAIITRDRNELRKLSPLNVSLSTDPNSWYLLETNYDQWKEPRSYDNRRYYGNEYMKAAGQAAAASMDGLYSVFSKWPIRNEGTSYTSMMDPKNFEIVSYNVYYSNNTVTQ